MTTIQFLGAAGTVTGSMHLVTANGRRVLLDCGLFQGLKDLRLRNWRDPAFDPKSLDAVVISHAHIDHTGALPLLVRRGYRGPIYCTAGTADLLGVLLPDSAHLQEEEADRANRYGYSKHKPALPLYTRDGRAPSARTVGADRVRPRRSRRRGISRSPTAVPGHILGAATVDLKLGAGPRMVFSGDLGRYDRPILPDPEPVSEADVLLLESTYGDRQHPAGTDRRAGADRQGNCRARAARCSSRRSWWIARRSSCGCSSIWRRQRRIPVLPVYVDSPSAIEVTEIYRRHGEEDDGEMRRGSRRQESAQHRSDPVLPYDGGVEAAE